MQAIVTKYLGPTERRGSRIKATAQAASVIVDYDDALSSEKNHTAAAAKLCARLMWAGIYIGGGTPDGDWVFVPVDSPVKFDAGA